MKPRVVLRFFKNEQIKRRNDDDFLLWFTMTMHHVIMPSVWRNFWPQTKTFQYCGGAPSYSPDLSPCDFFLFPRVKQVVKGTAFRSPGNLYPNVRDEGLAVKRFQKCYENWKKRMCFNTYLNICVFYNQSRYLIVQTLYDTFF